MPTSNPSIANEDWVHIWKAAGPRLAEVERTELRAMTEDERREAIHALLTLLPVWIDAPPTSGLVEQQKWFKKLAHHQTL